MRTSFGVAVLVSAQLSACVSQVPQRRGDRLECNVSPAVVQGVAAAALLAGGILISTRPCSETEGCDAGHDPIRFLTAPMLIGGALLTISTVVNVSRYSDCVSAARAKQL
jgi:hypothetical protein